MTTVFDNEEGWDFPDPATEMQYAADDEETADDLSIGSEPA